MRSNTGPIADEESSTMDPEENWEGRAGGGRKVDIERELRGGGEGLVGEGLRGGHGADGSWLKRTAL